MTVAVEWLSVSIVISLLVGFILGNIHAGRNWIAAWKVQERKHDTEVRETVAWASKEVIKAEEFFSAKMKEMVELKEHLQ